MAMLTELTEQLHSFLFWVLLEVYTQETTVRDAVVLNKELVCPHPLKIFSSVTLEMKHVCFSSLKSAFASMFS